MKTILSQENEYENQSADSHLELAMDQKGPHGGHWGTKLE
jgi:hypothetical protein